MLFKFSHSILDWTVLSRNFFGGFFETFLEGSVDLIIYRDYIVNRRFFIYWKATVGKDACGNFQSICGPFCNDDINERGLGFLEFATFNDLVLANTFGHHKESRGCTWYSPNGQNTTR